MASRHDESCSSDEGAPETISLSQSKQSVHRRETKLKKAEIMVKERKREENRERDRKLKERAERNKGKQKEKSGSSHDLELEARMQRAMEEAHDEMDEDESGDEEEFAGLGSMERSDYDESGEEPSNQGKESGSDEESDAESNSNDANSNDADWEEQPGRKSNPDHLPDELFEAAFKASTASSKRKAEDIDAKTQLSSRKRKRNNEPPKDLIIGSRAIRILPDGNKPSTPSARPSRKIRNFLDRTLALKGGNPKARGWERRPVNIGTMRRNGGPAANFVRG